MQRTPTDGRRIYTIGSLDNAGPLGASLSGLWAPPTESDYWGCGVATNLLAVSDSPRVLIGLGAGLCFIAAFAGALLALAIDDPDIVVTERVVEVAPPPPDLSPPPEAFDALRADYVERTGIEDEWTTAVVEEIAGGVCDGHYPLPTLAEYYESDPGIVLGGSELLDFMTQVQSACSTG